VFIKKKKIVMTETNEWLEAHIKNVFQRTPNDFSVAAKVAPLKKKLEAHVLGVHLNFLLG
jgi:hypothetical protein